MFLLDRGWDAGEILLAVLCGHLRKNYDVWVAAVLVGLVASVSLTLALGLTIAGVTSGGADQEQYSSIGGIQIGFTAVAGTACVAVMVRMVIGMSRVEIAQWQLAGVSTKRIAVLVLMMVLMCSLVGGAAGAVLGWIGWGPLGGFVRSSGLPDFPGLSEPLPVGAIWGGPSCGVAASLVAGVLNLRAVTRVEAIEAVDLHPMNAGAARPNPFRLLLVVVLVGGLVTAYWGVSVQPPSSDVEELSGVFSAYWGCALLAMMVALAIGRPLFGLIFRAICLLLPSGDGVGIYLTKAAVLRRSVYSSAMVAPLLVGEGAVGSIYGMDQQIRDTTDILGVVGASISPPRQMMLVFGGSVLVTMATGVGVVFATNRQRWIDLSRLRAMGVGVAVLLGGMLLEFIIYFIGTSAICYLALSVNGLMIARAMDEGPVPGSHFVSPSLVPLAIIASGVLVSLLCALMFVGARTLDRWRNPRKPIG